jgi:hemoglobin
MNMRECRVLAACSLLTLGGCFGGGQSRPAESGDPEADQRAQTRVESEERRGPGDARSKDRTLYERLGGAATITALVDDLTARATADPRVNFERRNVSTSWFGTSRKPWQPTPENIDRFKKHMVEFLTLATGGPAEYTGGEVREVHKGMRITNNEFDAMVGDIKTSLDKLGIATREKRDLLAVIETTRKQIVEKQ